MTWYEEDIKGAIRQRLLCAYKPETVFYGSSTFTLWTGIYEAFKEFKPVNLGFGGSTLTACLQCFDRIVAPLSPPSRFILYAGDNDLGDGASPEHVFKTYLLFHQKLRTQFNDIPFYYISIKPSLNRVAIIDKIKKTNELIAGHIETLGGNNYFIDIYDKMLDSKGQPQKNYFESDGLHLNSAGYDVLKEAILNEFALTEQLLQ